MAFCVSAAFCGASFSDDDKEELKVDHSLKNVVAFSATKKEMCCSIKQEGLVKTDDDGKEIDRRIKVDYSKDEYGLRESYRILCHLTAYLPDGRKMAASCFKIMLNKQAHIMTCGHNILGWSLREGKLVNFESICAYEMRQDENSWVKCRRVNASKVRIHPKFDGNPHSGFDIAVARLGQNVEFEAGDCKELDVVGDVKMSFCNPEFLEKGMTIEVAGYPGEKRGCPHTHSGNIVDVIPTKGGGHLLLHDVDCTSGNSGSPIMVTDERYLEAANTPKGVSKVVIGIHSGHDEIGNVNFGTLITQSLYGWIHDHSIARKSRKKRTSRRTIPTAEKSLRNELPNSSSSDDLGKHLGTDL